MAAFTVCAAQAASCGSGGLSHRPTGGLADSLDDSKGAFRMASAAGGLDRSECARPKADQRPLSSEIADEKCSL